MLPGTVAAAAVAASVVYVASTATTSSSSSSSPVDKFWEANGTILGVTLGVAAIAGMFYFITSRNQLQKRLSKWTRSREDNWSNDHFSPGLSDLTLADGLDEMSERVDEQVGSSPFTRWEPIMARCHMAVHRNALQLAMTLLRGGAMLMQGYLDYYTRWIPSTRFHSSYVRWAAASTR